MNLSIQSLPKRLGPFSVDPISLTMVSAWLLLATGCGAGPKTHPVQGRLEIAGGATEVLAGHTIELALDADPQIRAAGTIQDDGTFAVETIHSGMVLQGALPGAYKARIVLGDDDPAKRKLAQKSLPARYLDFEKSGLSLAVPSADEAKFTVLRR